MEENSTQTETAGIGKKGVIIAIVALVAVIAIGYLAYHALAGESAQPQAVSSAERPSGLSEDAILLADYDSTVYDATGRPSTMTQIADGKPLVINFWATWCPYCIQEMPDFLEIYNDYRNRASFAFVDCVDGQRETVEDGSSWLEENGFEDLPAYYDTKQEAQMAYGASSLPTTVVASAEGEILTISPGAISPERMRSALDSLLAE